MRRFGSRLALTVLAVALLVSLAGRITYADDGTVTPTLDPVPIVDPTVDSTIPGCWSDRLAARRRAARALGRGPRRRRACRADRPRPRRAPGRCRRRSRAGRRASRDEGRRAPRLR